jgi:hypothetical protein
LDAISCAGSFCAAASTSGDVAIRRNGRWSIQAVDVNPILAVSCPSATFCLATDSQGEYLKWNGKRWTAPSSRYPFSYGFSRGLVAVSCPSATFCVAVDEAGHEIFFTGTAIWQHWADVVGGAFTSVACPTTWSFCVAVDATGYEVTFTDVGSKLAWSAPKKLDDVALTSVACASSNFCIAVDDLGRYLTYSDGTWQSPVGGLPAAPPNSISCIISTCVDVGGTRASVASIT